jgi:hypothetical protein
MDKDRQSVLTDISPKGPGHEQFALLSQNCAYMVARILNDGLNTAKPVPGPRENLVNSGLEFYSHPGGVIWPWEVFDSAKEQSLHGNDAWWIQKQLFYDYPVINKILSWLL